MWRIEIDLILIWDRTSISSMCGGSKLTFLCVRDEKDLLLV